MGHFLAVTAFRQAPAVKVAEAITAYLTLHQVSSELVASEAPRVEATDAEIFAPKNDWTLVFWPPYFSAHDFPLTRHIGLTTRWTLSSVHVYDDDFWEHLAVAGAEELHSFCSQPAYWGDDVPSRERVAKFRPDPERLAALTGADPHVLASYLVDAATLADPSMKAQPDDEFELENFWVFIDFWRRLGIEYPDRGERPASVVRLSKWYAKRLPTE